MNASEPLMMPRQVEPRQAEDSSGVQGLAAVKRRVPVGQLNRRPGGHHRPRGIEGTHPGRVLLVRNVETPTGSGQRRLPGEPTVRKADPPSGNRMVKKPTPARRKATGNRDDHGGPFRRRSRITGRIRASARPERALT